MYGVITKNEEILMGNETNDINIELFKSFLGNYQKEKQIMREGSDFMFESVELLDYHLHKISLKRGKPYIKSPEWLINKRATINPKNKDNKCFQYSITVALNHQSIENHPKRISSIKPFIDQYYWEGMDFPSGIKDWKKFEQNNKTIALNILFVPHNTKAIRLAYKSKDNRKRENQVVLLMITDGKKRHYLALKSVRTTNGYNRPVRSLSRLLRRITSNHIGDFYCLGCLQSFRTDNALKKHEKLCDKHDYCHVRMPTEDKKILKYNHGEKSSKAPFTIIFDLECLLKKEQSCQNNPEKSYAEIKAKHEPSGYSLSLICSFDATKNRHYFYRGKDCIENFCKKIKELGREMINYKEKEMIPLTDIENKLYEKQKECHICKKDFCTNENNENEFEYKKVRDHCHYTGKFRGAAHSICNLSYKVPKEISVVIHSGSTYDDHFIIKQLAEKFKGQFECLGENAEKYITFSVPIKK